MPLPPEEGPFGKVVEVQLGINGIPDVAVVSDEHVLVLADPGRRVESAVLDEPGVRDLAVFPQGAGVCDALLLARDSGVSLWDWTDLSPAKRLELTGSWSAPRQVHVCPLSPPWQAVVVWDQDGSVHPFRLKRETSGAFVQSDLPTWLAATTPGAMVLADVVGTSTPEVVVSQPDGVRFFGLTGSLLHFSPGPAPLALVACGTTSNGKARLVWVEPGASPTEYMFAFSAGFTWMAPATVDAQGAIGSVVPHTDSGGSYLSLGLKDGRVRILHISTSIPPTIDAITSVDTRSLCTSWPLLADLTVSACGTAPDLFTIDAESSSAMVRRGLEDGGGSASIILKSLAISGDSLVQDGSLSMTLDPPTGTKLVVTTYPWPVLSSWEWGPRFSSWQSGSIESASLPLPVNVEGVVFEVVLQSDQPGPLTPLGAAYYLLKVTPPLSVPPFECDYRTMALDFHLYDVDGVIESPRGVVPIPEQKKPICPCGF